MNIIGNTNLIEETSKLAPVVLFTYNRLDHTEKTINYLKNNYLSDKTTLYIISDGPKNDNDIKKVDELRVYLHQISGFKKVIIIERKKNFGLAKNIVSGITQIINHYGKIIVLEDDIITSPYFLAYMNNALNRYEKHSVVMSVSGYIPPIDAKELPDYFFMPWFDCWGWGTWKDRWYLLEKSPKKIIKESKLSFIRRLNVDGSSPDMWSTLIDNYRGKKKTWAIFYFFSICKANGLVLYPKNPFCKNIGFDGTGENCEDGNVYNVELCNEFNINLIFPSRIEPNYDAIDAFRRFNYNRIKFFDRVYYSTKMTIFYIFRNKIK
jgi:hypothetical protein